MSTDPTFWDSANTTIDAVVSQLGVTPASVRTTTPGGTCVWTLRRGSASVVVFLRRARETEDCAYVRVIAPVARVPSPVDVQLLRHVLELNARGLSSAAFGLQDDTLVIVSERPARGLDTSEMSFIVRTVGTLADHYDDQFVKQFGLTVL